jgi:hypothetical protein
MVEPRLIFVIPGYGRHATCGGKLPTLIARRIERVGRSTGGGLSVDQLIGDIVAIRRAIAPSVLHRSVSRGVIGLCLPEGIRPCVVFT